MTTPITFTKMNTAASTDSADMPHVLGDPADALWEGSAERANNNFAAVTAWCQTQTNLINSSRIPVLARDATVITAATNWALTWAYAYTLTFYGAAKFIWLSVRLSYTGSTIVIDGGLPSQTIGTLTAAYRPQVNNYFRNAASYYQHGATVENNQIQCDLNTASNGVVSYIKPSVPYASGQKPTDITWTAAYLSAP